MHGNTDIRIKKLMPEEIPQLRPLREELAHYHNRVSSHFEGIYPLNSLDDEFAHAVEMVKKGDSLVEAAIKADIIVGFCKSTVEHGFGYINWLYVREDCRGYGLGKTMVEHALAFFKAKSVSLVDLHVVHGNPNKSFYEHLGFAVRSEILSIQL